MSQVCRISISHELPFGSSASPCLNFFRLQLQSKGGEDRRRDEAVSGTGGNPFENWGDSERSPHQQQRQLMLMEEEQRSRDQQQMHLAFEGNSAR